MKAIFLYLTAGFLLANAVQSAPIQEPVPVKLGPKSFRDGDVIQILEIESTSPALEQGDLVTVQGQYRLESQKAASLQLLLTQVQGNGLEETDETQIVDAVEGWHPFEARIVIKHRGLLHLTFYDEETGKPFGGVYFGTEAQVAKADPSWIAHYDTGAVAVSENFERSGQEETIARLRYEYSFTPEVKGFLKSGEIEKAVEAESLEDVVKGFPEPVWKGRGPTGDLNEEWPPKEFRIENDKGKEAGPKFFKRTESREGVRVNDENALKKKP